jgi:membrane peptidoglycan carboxypeptidase
MVSNYFKPLNMICILCYIAFMGLALDSKAVEALVLYVSEHNGKPVYTTGRIDVATVASTDKSSSQIMAIQYKAEKTDDDNSAKALTNENQAASPVEVRIVRNSSNEYADNTQPVIKTVESAVTNAASIALPTAVAAASAIDDISPEPAQPQRIPARIQAASVAANQDSTSSALGYIEAIKHNKWEYATLLDRYIVRYDDETYIVLTIRPSLQKILEDAFRKSSTRIGAGIIQDPATGEILAMTSSHRSEILELDSEEFRTDNWVLKPTFPVASIFKIVTGAAGIDTGALTVNSSFLAWGKTYMKVWKAFATSHNGVFGRIAKKTGRDKLEKYAEAFGFNKPFFFDLPVGKSLATLPANDVKMGQAAAGLNKDFVVSPIHVASIVSTVLNRGKTMKPYLVDYVVRKNKVIFRRKPFQMAQPIKSSTARDIYKMMYATTSVGTGKKGFGGYRGCPDLAKICGGKTGTLTGASPHYLYTWFGGFTKATGRDLCIVTLSGQQNHSGVKASSIAGHVAYDLYMMRNGKKNEPIVSRKK